VHGPAVIIVTEAARVICAVMVADAVAVGSVAVVAVPGVVVAAEVVVVMC
jgi:hypothetical protein